jgi:uncharacterized protein (DUF2252 family)
VAVATTRNAATRGKVEHPTASERAERGKAARAIAPRALHAAWEPAADRRDPVEVLEEQAAMRVPELVPIRYGRMLSSPFAFYRGAAAIMAGDLGPVPRSGLDVQLCGDAHLSNFGIFAAPDRRLTFDLNDFDETLPGPFEWDVKRLAASFAVACRGRGVAAKQSASIAASVVRSYREAMRTFATMRNLDVWYARLDVDAIMRDIEGRASAAEAKRLQRGVAKTWAKDSVRALGKLTRLVDGEPRIVNQPPLIVPLSELVGSRTEEARHEAFEAFIRAYRRTLPGDRRRLLERFRYVDAARKVVGVGSVGTRAWIVLLLGRDGQDPLFLQAKEADPSVLEPQLGKSRFANNGQRVVEGQRLMQAASDIMLGWLRADVRAYASYDANGVAEFEARDFYVRQLWDAKGSVDVEVIDAGLLDQYAHLCGWTLARAHARSGDAIAIASYLGSGNAFDRAICAFAEAYADQNERDHAALKAAVADGRVKAETGI